jgi:hypothetical protein
MKSNDFEGEVWGLAEGILPIFPPGEAENKHERPYSE